MIPNCSEVLCPSWFSGLGKPSLPGENQGGGGPSGGSSSGAQNKLDGLELPGEISSPSPTYALVYFLAVQGYILFSVLPCPQLCLFPYVSLSTLQAQENLLEIHFSCFVCCSSQPRICYSCTAYSLVILFSLGFGSRNML